MKKKLLLFGILCVALGLSGASAQSGNEPKLAPASANQVGPGTNKPALDAKPVMAQAQMNERNNKKDKPLNGAPRHRATPQPAIASKNGIVEQEKK